MSLSFVFDYHPFLELMVVYIIFVALANIAAGVAEVKHESYYGGVSILLGCILLAIIIACVIW